MAAASSSSSSGSRHSSGDRRGEQLLVRVLDDEDVLDVRPVAELRRAAGAADGRRSRPGRRRAWRCSRCRRDAAAGSACAARTRRTGCRSTPRGAGGGSSRASRRGRRARARALRAPTASCFERRIMSRNVVRWKLRSGQARDDLLVAEERLRSPQQRRERQLEVHHQAVHRASASSESWSYRPGTGATRARAACGTPGRAAGPGSARSCADARVAPHEAPARGALCRQRPLDHCRDGLGRRAVRAALGRDPAECRGALAVRARPPARRPARQARPRAARRVAHIGVRIVPGSTIGDADAPRRELDPQRVGDRLERVLRSGIGAQERQCASARRSSR